MSQPKSTAPRRRNLLFPITVFFMSALLLFLAARMFGIDPLDFLLSEDKKFDRFATQVFCQEMSGNTLNLHYTLADPTAYAIDTAEVSFGDASLPARQASCAALENYKNRLKAFDYEKLSEKHQLTYDIFMDYLDTELSGSPYLLYDEPLSPTLGVQAQFPVLLAEYTFRTKGDIEDYLTLLSRIPDYFTSILSFERDKASAGLFMSASCAQEIAAQCQEFIDNPENNYLIEIFNEKIDGIANLTADEKISYKARNLSILTGYVIPAYQELGQKILSYAGSSKNSMGLYYLPEGTEYYTYLVKSITGDSRDIEAIEEAVKVQMVADYTAIAELTGQMTSSAQNTDGAASGQAADGAAGWSVPQSSENPEVILNELRQKITEDFPLLPNVSCSVKYVHDSLQEYLSPAFYLTPAIDDFENNVIYINPGSDYNSLELYTTLAHEGYPGHLYQSVYFNARQPDLLRNLLDVGGYTEGWATYVEMYAYSLWDGDAALASLYQHNRAFTLGLASLLDIGIHYRGYTPKDVISFLGKLGFSEETATSLYQVILQSPGNYLQYYVGYLNFCSLRDEFQNALGSCFSLKEFHQVILETGPAPFSILREQLYNRLIL